MVQASFWCDDVASTGAFDTPHAPEIACFLYTNSWPAVTCIQPSLILVVLVYTGAFCEAGAEVHIFCTLWRDAIAHC